MTNIHEKNLRERGMDKTLDRDIHERKRRERLCKLRGHVIEYLVPQLTDDEVLKVLNDARVYFKLHMMKKEQSK